MPRLLAIFLVSLLAACAGVPKTADESYARSHVVAQSSGGTLVISPEIPFTARGLRGVTGFQALVRNHKPVFYQMTSIGNVEEAGTFEVPRTRMEYFRRHGATLAVRDTSVVVRFPPQYIDGFLRRVDETSKR
jgi:hypothetical protein